MVVTRQDAWSEDEDLLLAEVVLRHIRESSTQLSAFEEVGKKLSRSSAACGFRWNSAIRKKYESAVALAKKQKSKKSARQSEQASVSTPASAISPQNVEVQTESKKETVVPSTELNLSDVITFLTEYQSKHEANDAYELGQLKLENEQLKIKLDQLSRDKDLITQDYKALLTIMDRARKFTRDHPIERTM
ncbi:RsfA family transcriptional regulator [Alkalicoccobacillus plakortidis]|uniref:RsfA family transcriptional regulator n=1 Tax=Alkalicoccobacillus plakortidis TaxID=444060 RepID=A0ABT0XG03_9BACI|nr:RsfA family transcriptional regulator [Alkalicoccobacillus plakortidis]MCM2674836.1 RsfA family transcriptional regulator [Alkalicoccobacillus plakortidis]